MQTQSSQLKTPLVVLLPLSILSSFLLMLFCEGLKEGEGDRGQCEVATLRCCNVSGTQDGLSTAGKAWVISQSVSQSVC